MQLQILITVSIADQPRRLINRYEIVSAFTAVLDTLYSIWRDTGYLHERQIERMQITTTDHLINVEIS